MCQNLRDIFNLCMITGDVDDDVDDPFCIKPSVIKPQENSSDTKGTITDTFSFTLCSYIEFVRADQRSDFNQIAQ